MKKFVIIIVLLVLLGGGVAIFALGGGADDNTETASTPNQSTNDQEPAGPAAEQTSYTAEQVAAHSAADDCWTIIRGQVYDLTTFINSHPGGSEILRACGQDATTLFESRRTGDGQPIGSGTPHSSTAESTLQSLRIGSLAQ